MTSAPFSVGGVYRNTNVGTAEGQSITLSRTEIVALNVIPSASYSPVELAINPGNSLLSPWLSKIARHYERFEYLGMVVKYVPSCSATTEGRICMAYEPDPLDPLPSTMLECQQIGGATSFPPWSDGTMVIPRKFFNAEATNAKFVQEDDTADLDYQHTAGKLIVCTQDGNGSIQTGYIQIHYKVRLMVPQLHSEDNGEFLHLTNFNAAMTPTTILNGATVPIDSGSDLQNHGISWTGQTLTAAPGMTGKFMVYVVWNPTGSTVGGRNTLFIPGGASALHSAFRDGSAAWISQIDTVGAASGAEMMGATDWHLLNSSGSTLVLPTCGTWGSTNRSIDVFIHRIPSSHNLASQGFALQPGVGLVRAPPVTLKDCSVAGALKEFVERENKFNSTDTPPPSPRRSVEQDLLDKLQRIRLGQDSENDAVLVDALEARVDGKCGSL